MACRGSGLAVGHDWGMGRLLLVEGTPGSGKTSTVRWAARWLARGGARVAAHCEGDRQPADLAWQWWLSPGEFEALCRRYPGAESELRRCAWVGAVGMAVAYTKVDVDRCGGHWPEVERDVAGREPVRWRHRPVGYLLGKPAPLDQFRAAVTAAGQH